jgi:hypothetical protein
MGFNKKFFTTGGIVASTPPAAAGLDPLQNFETVTYTGNGGTQKITGYIRKGAAFNGSSSEIDIPHNTEFDATGGLSISLWINKAVLDSSFDRVMDKANGGSGSYGWEIMYNSTVGYRFDVYDTSNNVSSVTSGSSAISAVGVWDHVVATVSSTGVAKIYVNGVLKNTTSALSNPISSNTGSVTIGRYFNASNGCTATFDQIRFFNTDIDQTAVDELFAEEYGDATVSTTDFGGYGGFALYQLDEDANDTGGSSGSLVSSPEMDLDVDGYTSGTVSDLSGNGNTATVTGATYGTDPNGGGYFEFDGSNDYMTVTGNSAFYPTTTTGITVECWFTSDTTDDGENLVNNQSSTGGYRLWSAGSSLYADTFNSSGTRVGRANAGTLSDNTWHHAVFTLENSTSTATLKLYLDGKLIATDASVGGAIGTTVQDLNIGRRPDVTIDRLDGKIGDVRIYGSELSSSQVAQNFNASKGSYGGGYDGTPTNVNFLGMAFQPDLVWIKSTSNTRNHRLLDSIRGATKILSSDSSVNEYNEDSLTSFDSNGFTLGTGGNQNRLDEPYVAWCWKAAGAAVSGTGTSGITNVEVSANTDAGFSIVKYEGSGTAGATITHGLDLAPELIIVKRTDTLGDWIVGSDYLTSWGHILQLNLPDAEAGYAGFNSTAPTTSVFTLGSNNPVNNASGSYIAYCFHSVDSYQRIGTYTGASGLRVYTDSNGDGTGTGAFQPRFLMVKKTTSANWVIIDSVRVNGIYEDILFPNTTDAEAAGNYDELTFNSDGFTWNQTENTKNAVGGEYIYLAIA